MSNIVAVLLLAVLGIVCMGLLFSLPVWLLWNLSLVPAIPGLLEITWLQAWGILILCGFLFKSTSVSTTKSE